MNFAFYQGGITNRFPTKNINLVELAALITSDRYKVVVLRLQAEEVVKNQKEIKKTLDYVTPGGTFHPYRQADYCQERSGLIVIDLDDVENLYATKIQLEQDPYARMIFVSPSGTGLKVLVAIETTKEHKDYFNDLSFYFQREYNLKPDSSGSDISRACYLSYDPDLFFNEGSQVWKYRGLKPQKEETKNLVSTENKKRSTGQKNLKQIRALVDQIEANGLDITTDYGKEWLLIAFSLSTLGEDGRELFHRVSRQNPGYDEQETDAKFTNALKESRFTNPAKFFSICQDYGMDITLGKGKKAQAEGEPATEAATEGESQPEQPKPEKAQPVKERSRRLSTAMTSVHYDDEEMTLLVKSGKNWVTCCDGYFFYLRYVTEDEQENVSWIIEFQPFGKEQSFTLELTNKEFLSPDSFDEAIASRGLALNAGKAELKLIRTYNFQKWGVKKAVKVIRFGFHEQSNTYFFSNKAFNGEIVEPDENNIIHTNGKHVVLPSLNDDLDDRFILTPAPMSFNQWYELYVKAYLWDNAFLPVCFYLTSLFRDVALAHKKIAPLLYVYGVAGTGKSSVLRSLTNLFGREQPEINLKADNTDAVVPKMLSIVSNGLVQFDEMTDDSKFQGMFQASYDNIGRMRTPDNARGKLDFESIDVKSMIMLTANHMPKYQPFLERCLFMINNNKKKTEDQRKNWEILQDLGKGGLAGISVELFHHRELVKREYSKAYNTLLRKFKSLFPGDEIYERNFNNVTQLLTVAYILKVNGKIDLGMEECDEPDVLDAFAQIAYQQIIFQHRILSEKSALSEFIEMIQWLYDNNKIYEGVHFRFDGPFVMLRFSSIYTSFKQQYYFQYQQPAPTKDAIEEEIIQFETPAPREEIFKGIRFRDPDNPEEQKLKDKVNHSCVMTYTRLQERYGLDLMAKRT